MNPQDPLAQLLPLREPATIGWWPLATGWWLLLALAVLGLATLLWILLRRYRANAYRRLALQRLQSLDDSLEPHANPLDYYAAVNALLKSVALHAFGRRVPAALSGRPWLEFLDSTCGQALFAPEFAEAAYRSDPPTINPEQLSAAAAAWIRSHRVTP